MLGFSSNEGAIPLLLVKGENTEKQPRVKGDEGFFFQMKNSKGRYYHYHVQHDIVVVAVEVWLRIFTMSDFAQVINSERLVKELMTIYLRILINVQK